MVQILPFRGLRYQLDQVESLENVTAPPYDVISSQDQQKLYDKHPANVVRLILNQKSEQDSDTNNVYTRSKAFWEQWLQDGTLALENKPCVYAYSQEWQGIERKGMIGLLQLEPLNVGKVLPHEFTLGGPKKDRLELMKSTLANLSQIFMIYSDPERALETLTEPYFQNKSNLIEAIDKDKVKHRLIPIPDPAIHQQVQALFEDKSLLIADGHHRYETALILQQEIRHKCYKDKGIEEPPVGSLLCDYLMVFLTNMDDPGLKVYPTHRVL
ncbi:MAG: DUF1015 domain-containing protein, partial [Cyanobacteria bacterium]|nr:DUF1015 domain-containing protein [Cyanobacteriota bacterium]